MSVYLIATVLGLLGLILMAVLGAAHTASHGHTAHAHGPSGSVKTVQAAGGHASSVPAGLLSLASPRVLLSLALGFGLTGLLLSGWLPALAVLLLAVLGAALFEGLLIRPYWNFLLRFESRPSLSLASAAGGPAWAATDFDRRGAGLVTFELNGETRQMLARQEDAGQPLRRGEALTIGQIDEEANACTVRRS